MGNQPSNESGASRGQDQSHIHAGGHHVNHSTNHYSSSTHPPQQQQYASQGSAGRPSSTHSSPPQYTPQYSPSSHSATGYQMGGATVRPSSSRHPNSNVPPTSSDASMGNNSMEISTHHPKGPTSPSSSSSNLHPSISSSEDDVVPTVFRWEHGGREVYITGTFNGWTRQIPMHRSGNDFTYIHNLKRGKHAFKFIVDDEWRFAPDQPTVADIEGRINNFIDVTDFKPYMGDKSFEQEKNAAYYARRHPVLADAAGSNSATVSAAALGKGYGHPMSSEDGSGMDRRGSHHGMYIDDPDGEVFTTDIPDLDEYTKDPPPLPPHLRHIILNKPPQLQDTAALPVPQHVALNHLYCTAIRDNMMVLGITQRYRTKFVTTVYYSPELTR